MDNEADYPERSNMYSYDLDDDLEIDHYSDLFSDPFSELMDLKMQNQLLLDKISFISQKYSSSNNIELAHPEATDQQIDKLHDEFKRTISPPKTKIKSNVNKNQFIEEQKIQHRNQPPKIKEKPLIKQKKSATPNYSKVYPIPQSNPSFKQRYIHSLSPQTSREERNLIKKASDLLDKFEKVKNENEKLNKKYKSMLLTMRKTKEDVEILREALENSENMRLSYPHYPWSPYSEKSFFKNNFSC